MRSIQADFHLKSKEKGYCLERKAKNSFSFSECDNFSLGQQWFKFKLPFNVGFYISSGNGSLAVVSPSWFSNKNSEVSLQTCNVRSLNQKLIFHQETQQLQSVVNKLGLFLRMPVTLYSDCA